MLVKRRPAISVVMLNYNYEKYLSRAIESVLNQSFEDFEFIIVDDKSTDSSPEIIRRYKDPRIVLIENSVNKGIVESYYIGCCAASGKYIARLDSDDWWWPHKLELQYNFMENNPDISLLLTYANLYLEKEKRFLGFRRLGISHEDIKLHLLFNCFYIHSTCFMRREFYFLIGKSKDKDIRVVADDYDLYVRGIDKGKFFCLPFVTTNYKIADDSTDSMEVKKIMGDKCRKMMLSKIGIIADEELIEEFNSLVIKNKRMPKTDIHKTILNQNKQYNYFNQSKLENLIKYFLVSKINFNLLSKLLPKLYNKKHKQQG